MKLEGAMDQLNPAAKEKLDAAANSPEGRAVAEKLDEAALKAAAQRGDTAALKQMLHTVLTSPEGKALAEKVQKAMGGK